MANKANISDFLRKVDAITKAYERMPDEVAAIAVKFSKERFREQGWLDESFHPWKPRKIYRKGKKRSQTLLVNTGRLKRSIRKLYANSKQIAIGTDVPYAELHNNGGVIKETVTVNEHTVKAHQRKASTRVRAGRTETVKAHSVKQHSVSTHTRQMNLRIPARPFIGQSAALERQIVDHITNAFAEAFKK
jgi:Mu-like prophage protein gpG